MSTIAKNLKPARPPEALLRWPDNWRRRAVRMAATMRQVDVAYLFSIHPATLHRWRQLAEEGLL